MKNLLFIIFLISSLNSNAIENDLGKLPNPFQLKERKTDVTMAKGTSKFILSFWIKGVKYTSAIDMGFNERSFNTQPDTNGIFSYVVGNGKYKLYFYLDGYNEVISDSLEIKSQEIIKAEINFQKTDEMIIVLKPVIYVYPTEETKVNIQLNVNGNLGFTYPSYNDGWNFTANPDGKIKMDGKEYNYLFWDSEMPKDALNENNRTGFLVSSDTLLSFLENTLDQMGFTSIESADFITFWYPQMIKNEKNYVHFLFNDACNAYAELIISPKPENIFRVGMVWTEANSDFVPEPQKILTVNRNVPIAIGITVIEWGGMINKTLFTNEN